MFPQAITSHESSIAMSADVGFCTRVPQLVSFQAHFSIKSLFTFGAYEWFFIGVRSFMFLQRLFVLKFLVTLLASERPFVCVDLVVLSQT